MTPAALRAPSVGDEENFLVASMPGGIKRQEKKGQMDQANKQTLPITGTSERGPWESLGFVFGNAIDRLFVEATFPKGWKKVPTDHSMWSDIVDQHGRKRGSIFYKAAFYDQSAHAHLECRFHVGTDYGDGVVTPYIHDGKKEVEKRGDTLPKPNWSNREEARQRQDAIDNESEKLRSWLDKNYAGWESSDKHWD